MDSPRSSFYLVMLLANYLRLPNAARAFKGQAGGALMQNAGADNRAVLFPVQPLSGSWLFDGLDPDRLKLLHEAHGPQRRAEAQAHLVRAVDPAPPVVTVSCGWAFRYVQLSDGRRQILSVALPGD